ncbi:MAG: hypothetical protein KKE11_01595 [Gammaproteobacteria bacterium]|nr:hypothetical protein [Gammaproteobacteria bacterium]
MIIFRNKNFIRALRVVVILILGCSQAGIAELTLTRLDEETNKYVHESGEPITHELVDELAMVVDQYHVSEIVFNAPNIYSTILFSSRSELGAFDMAGSDAAYNNTEQQGTNNGMFKEGVVDKILLLLKNRNIRKVNISGHNIKITCQQALIIADALRNNPKLEDIFLSGNTFDYDGAIEILDGLVRFGFNLVRISLPVFPEAQPSNVFGEDITNLIRNGGRSYVSNMYPRMKTLVDMVLQRNRKIRELIAMASEQGQDVDIRAIIGGSFLPSFKRSNDIDLLIDCIREMQRSLLDEMRFFRGDDVDDNTISPVTRRERFLGMFRGVREVFVGTPYDSINVENFGREDQQIESNSYEWWNLPEPVVRQHPPSPDLDTAPVVRLEDVLPSPPPSRENNTESGVMDSLSGLFGRFWGSHEVDTPGSIDSSPATNQERDRVSSVDAGLNAVATPSIFSSENLGRTRNVIMNLLFPGT